MQLSCSSRSNGPCALVRIPPRAGQLHDSLCIQSDSQVIKNDSLKHKEARDILSIPLLEVLELLRIKTAIKNDQESIEKKLTWHMECSLTGLESLQEAPPSEYSNMQTRRGSQWTLV